MKNVEIIVKENRCNGCSFCFSSCPNNSIIFIYDAEYGHPVPLIAQTACVDCGTCLSACPSS